MISHAVQGGAKKKKNRKSRNTWPWTPLTELIPKSAKVTAEIQGLCESKGGNKEMYIHLHGSLSSQNICPAGLLGQGYKARKKKPKAEYLFLFLSVFELGSAFMFTPSLTILQDRQLFNYLICN